LEWSIGAMRTNRNQGYQKLIVLNDLPNTPTLQYSNTPAIQSSVKMNKYELTGVKKNDD